MLENDRNGNKEYDERVLKERYKSGDKCVKSINFLTELCLILNIIFTVIYSVYYFSKL